MLPLLYQRDNSNSKIFQAKYETTVEHQQDTGKNSLSKFCNSGPQIILHKGASDYRLRRLGKLRERDCAE